MHHSNHMWKKTLNVTSNKRCNRFSTWKTDPVTPSKKPVASAAWHGTKSCCDGAWAVQSLMKMKKQQRDPSLWTCITYTKHIYIYMNIARPFKICANAHIYMNHEIASILWAKTVEVVLNHFDSSSVRLCGSMFGDCFEPAWAAQRRWQGQWRSCILGHSECHIFRVRLLSFPVFLDS